MQAAIHATIGAAVALVFATAASAADCPADHDKLEKALKASVKPSGGPTNGGLDNNEWAALVTRDGAVCAVAFSGGAPSDQWPGVPGMPSASGYGHALCKGAESEIAEQIHAGFVPRWAKVTR
jgi:hypothetical protein